MHSCSRPQDGLAWGTGSLGLLFLFIILLVVILTWRRCPPCEVQARQDVQLAETKERTAETTASTARTASTAESTTPEPAPLGGRRFGSTIGLWQT
jgi:hypothetical protein